MNDPLDNLLDARLRDETAFIDDAGFTARAKSRDPENVTFKLSHRDPSTALGMTVIMRRKARALVLRQSRFAFRALRRFRIFSPAARTGRILFRYRRRRCCDENREDELRSCARPVLRKQSAGSPH